MGRSLRSAARRARRRSRVHGVKAFGLVAVVGAGVLVAELQPLAAQTLTDAVAGRTQSSGGEKDRMLVEAKELIYNRDSDVVTANGNVQIYYQGKVLQADRVVYDRKTKRVVAEGNTKLTEVDGTVSYAQKFELTDDFRDGFVNSLKARTVENGTITAPRGERIGGETSVFERATYTSCAPCAEHPERPPFWQIRATKIIHKNQEQTLYYENAALELFGYPIAYFPYLSSPDGTVNRKTGFLPPHYLYGQNLGYGLGIPFFWAIAPNYDLTLTPTYLTQQGLLGQAEFRQRLTYGTYSIRATGIYQDAPSLWPAAPYDTQQAFRGAVQTEGKFYLSQKFTVGWDAILLSDKFFVNDYKLKADSITTNYFRDATSTAFITGKGDRGYFDLRGYYFEGLDQRDVQQQLPIAHPVMEYNKVFMLPKDVSHGIGGEVTVDLNVTSLSRQLADYQSVGARILDSTYGLYNVCGPGVGGANGYVRGNCLLRGIGGEYDRATAEASWKRTFFDSTGGMWQPFAFARASGTSTDLDLAYGSSVLNSAGQPLTNANQSNFLSSSVGGSAMPGVGVEYRFPLVSTSNWASQVFEPIAQIIVRPNEIASRSTVNEDAQSLIFDDTNLFEWNKFSGYDRFEGGTRANVGAQYTAKFNWGGTLSALAGQSYQVAGRNSYSYGDVANVGLDSGLQNAVSDYVTRVSFTPYNGYDFIAKGNFDPTTFALKRLDLAANVAIGRRIALNVQYAKYDAQPDIGFSTPREGLLVGGRYNLTDHYYLNGSIIFDLSKQYQDALLQTKTTKFAIGSVVAGGGYDDECLSFAVNYASGYSYGIGTETSGQSVIAQLTFKTLGTAKASGTLGAATVADGVATRGTQ